MCQLLSRPYITDYLRGRDLSVCASCCPPLLSLWTALTVVFEHTRCPFKSQSQSGLIKFTEVGGRVRPPILNRSASAVWLLRLMKHSQSQTWMRDSPISPAISSLSLPRCVLFPPENVRHVTELLRKMELNYVSCSNLIASQRKLLKAPDLQWRCIEIFGGY